MYSDRKSMAPPRTPTSSAHKNAFHYNMPPSGYRAGGRPTTDFSRQSIFRPSMVAEARSSIATGAAYSMSGRPSAIPGNQGKRITPLPKNQPIKDDRNLRDRNVQDMMIRKVVRFLEDRDQPPPSFRFDDKNFLRAPNKNDFKNVFEYLFSCIEPTFRVKKIEEDALHLMNTLGFPYHLKHSTMQTMTVPSYWPQMLGILDWLVDMVEIENGQYQERQKLCEDAQWKLLTSCFKKTLAKGPANQQGNEPNSFEVEFEEYRREKMADNGIDSDAFDELVAKRVAQEHNIKQYEELIEEEKKAIVELEQDIEDLTKDIAAVEKFCEELVVTASQEEQHLNSLKANCEDLMERFDKLVKENAEKERQIAAQKLSGEEARALTGKRQMLREELVVMREKKHKAEARRDELQPKCFKQLSTIREDYRTFLKDLCALCESLVPPGDLEVLFDELDQCNFDLACMEFQRSRDDNKLTRVMAQLKELAARKMLVLQQVAENGERAKDQLQQRIAELGLIRDQRQTKYQLELERAKRLKDDKQKPVVDLKHAVALVNQKYKMTEKELDKYNQQLASLHDELAEKHKSYLAYKQELDSQYSKVQVEALEKMAKLGEQFQHIQDQKQHYKELGEELLSKNSKVLKEMRAEKAKREVPK